MKDTVTGQVTIEPGDSTVNIDAIPLPNGAFIKFDTDVGRLRVVYADGTKDYLLLESEVPGGGDMLKATYDPTNINSSAFLMANMVEGATQKILTDTERTAIASALAATDIDTLAKLNAILTDVVLDDASDPRDPNSHAASHVNGTDDIQSATNAQKGLATAAHIQAIEANTAKTSNATHTGEVTGSGVLTIANDAVTYAKMQNVSTASRLIGRGSAGGAGDPQEITLGSGLTMTGTELSSSGGSVGDGTITNAKLADDIRSRVVTLTFDETITPDPATQGRFWTVTLTGDTTLGSWVATVGHFTLIVKQDNIGNHSMAFGADFHFPGAVAPTLSTAADAVDILNFISDGVAIYCIEQLDFRNI